MPYEADRPDNVHRLNMGVFPEGARIVPNPYNKIPGFSCNGPGGGAVHFVPGFPVMAWPMIEWVLDHEYPHLFNRSPQTEQSVIVFGAMESALAPLMERIEQQHPDIKLRWVVLEENVLRQRVTEAELGEFADGVRQQIDSNAQRLQVICAFQHECVETARMQGQGCGESADTAAGDEYWCHDSSLGAAQP